MINRKIKVPALAATIGIHVALALALTNISPSPRINSKNRDEVYLVNIALPKTEYTLPGTVKQQRHTYLEPSTNQKNNITTATHPFTPGAANLLSRNNNKISFSPPLENTTIKTVAYQRIASEKLPSTGEKQIAILSLNLTTKKLGPGKFPLLKRSKKQLKINHAQHTSGKLRAYKQAIISKILAAKIYPAKAQKMGQEGVICLRFLLSKDGELKDVQLANTSQYALLNQAAVQTVKKAGPFQPLPDTLKQSELWLQLAITYTLKK